MTYWNLTKSKLPADNVLVFIVDTLMPHYNYRIGYLKQGKWYTHFGEEITSDITHWVNISSDYPIPKRKARYWCNCDWPNIRVKDKSVICVDCEGIVECELCEDRQPAVIIHIDYRICKKHEDAAIDAVADRRW